MEIQKFVILKKYLEWVDQVTEDIEDKSSFEPTEIVFKICEIIKEEQEPTKETFMKAAEVEAEKRYPFRKDIDWVQITTYRKEALSMAKWAFEQLKKD